MKGRLALKRPGEASGPPDEGKRRAGAATQQAPQPLAAHPNGSASAAGGALINNWAADFAAEVEQGAAARDGQLHRSHGRHDRREQRQRQHAPHRAGAAADVLKVVPESSDEEEEEEEEAKEEEGVVQQGWQGQAMTAAASEGAAALEPMQLSPPGDEDDVDDEEARKGLTKVANSMRRRVDAGWLQLEAQRRLLLQKQALLASSEAVLADHCRATFQQHQQPAHLRQLQERQSTGSTGRSASSSSVTVHSLQAECAAGQWWLHALVTLTPNVRQPVQTSSRLSLLAVSSACNLVCREQQCRPADASSSGGDDHGGGPGCSAVADGAVGQQQQQELTAALDLQHEQLGYQGQWGHGPSQLPPGDVWADVFLLEERHAEAGTTAAAAVVALAGATSGPPVLLGRVQLRRQDWLQSHSRPPAALAPQQQQRQHTRALAVSSDQLDLSCLHQIVQQQLGCAPASSNPGGGSGSERAAAGQEEYVLPGPPPSLSAQAGQHSIAASLSITQHGSGFAEVELRSGNAALLQGLEQALGEGLQAAAAGAQSSGTAGASVKLGPSMLPPQRAQQVGAAADVLVEELDASIEWVEALLKQKLFLESRERRQQPAAPGMAAVRQRQAGALVAMAATDECMVRLLS